jgi:hypothetical protein
MKLEYRTKDERLEITISEEPNWRLFNGVADAIIRKFGGKLIEHLDGLEQRYWDIEIKGVVVTLHLENYTGISLFAQSETANNVIREIGRYLEGIEPKELFLEFFYLRNFMKIRSKRRWVFHVFS